MDNAIDRGLTLFVRRLKRQGNHDNFVAATKVYIAEHGCNWADAYRALAPDFGYVDEAFEEELLKRYEDLVVEQKMVEPPRQKRPKSEAERFEEAVLLLPENAPPNDEWDYIRSHPAMSRKARLGESSEIVLRVEDITGSHTPPSRACVHMLQHWVNCPAEFFKKDMDHAKHKLRESLSKERPALDPKDTKHEEMGIKQAMRLLSGYLASDTS